MILEPKFNLDVAQFCFRYSSSFKKPQSLVINGNLYTTEHQKPLQNYGLQLTIRVYIIDRVRMREEKSSRSLVVQQRSGAQLELELYLYPSWSGVHGSGGAGARGEKFVPGGRGGESVREMQVSGLTQPRAPSAARLQSFRQVISLPVFPQERRRHERRLEPPPSLARSPLSVSRVKVSPRNLEVSSCSYRLQSLLGRVICCEA
jgi:hypothetical protein